MEEPRIRNEDMEKDVDNFSKGKLEQEEEKRVIHILEDTEGKDETANANTGRKDERSKIDSLKKTKKFNHKTNVTVPQPFNLATEKRMTRERKGSMDFKESKPILITKSASFNHKSSHLKGNGSVSIRKNLQPKVRTNEKDDKNTEEGDKMKNKLKEKTTFKALPLPNFYRLKECPSKSEAKKMVVEHSKPPMIGDQVKKTAKIR